MKKYLLASAIIGGLSAQAGVLTVASYPVVHPNKTAAGARKGVKATAKVVFYPAAHPKKTARYILPPILL